MDLIKQHILVTGADGFIGSHLTEMLLAKGAKVKALSLYNSFNNWGWLEAIPPHADLEVVCGDIRDPHFCKEITKWIVFISGPDNARSNYWLNAIILKDRKERDAFLEATNASGVQTRPVWTLMNRLPMYRNCHSTSIDNAQWFEDRLVNIPSSVRVGAQS